MGLTQNTEKNGEISPQTYQTNLPKRSVGKLAGRVAKNAGKKKMKKQIV